MRYGLCEEFVARFSVVCTLDPLDAGDLREILLQARGSPLADTKAYYALHGIDLEFDDAAIDAIGRGPSPSERAPRALRRLMHACWPMSSASSRSRPPPASAPSPALVDGELRVRALRPVAGDWVTRAEQLRAERRLAGWWGGDRHDPRRSRSPTLAGWSDERIRCSSRWSRAASAGL